MDRRSWPWKKKSSDKAAGKAAVAADAAAAALASNGTQNEKPKYVQISVEQYSNLTSLEDKVETYEEQVQSLEDKINELNEKLTAANSEMNSKDILVKQHAKVAEEAVSGWEKAEAEAVALKGHLESVTLSKLTADDRAAHLDGALKECMRQIRNLKEEHEQKMQDLAFSKTKQLEKMKLELEGKMSNLEQELLHSAAENAALSRSLQDRSNMLIKINEDKSQAEAEIELLKSNIESCEREINSFKYELHVLSKELEIRNEEKNMCMRSAEAANKQHMDGVKKIAKLEAECQRLRGLVRKKLPGPAALAQMKLEVDSLGRDYGESRLRRSPAKPSSPNFSPLTEFSLDNVQKYQKENEFLTERLLAMEEETKMLKEALAKRNGELQATRSICAKTASKLQNFEAQLHISNHQSSSPKSAHLPIEGSLSQHASSPPSLTSFSEDGLEDDKSCAESCATGVVSELSHFKKERNNDQPSKVENSNHLNLMEDFLEMEKLACMSNDSNGGTSVSNSSNAKVHDAINYDGSGVAMSNGSLSKEHNNSNVSNHISSSIVKSSQSSPGSDADQLPLMKLQSRISTLLDSSSKQMNLGKILEEIKHAVQETYDTLKQDTASCIIEDVHCSNANYDRQDNLEDGSLTTEKDNSSCQSPEANVYIITDDLEAAISNIHDFVLFLNKEANGVHGIFPDDSGFSQKIEEFSTSFSKFKCSNLSLADFVVELSQVLTKASELRFNIMGFKGVELETSSPDCIDKVALPENMDVQKNSSSESYQNGCGHITSPTSDSEVPDDGNVVLGYSSNTASGKFSLEEFQQLKSEKDSLAKDLAKCTESLEITNSQLHQTEQLLAEAKSQLASAEKTNSLAETQLKCMAESYRSLEKRAQELERELNVLRSKIETVENELQDEKSNHEDALIRCKELEEQLQRLATNLMRNECSVSSSATDNEQTKQDKDLEAAAEKLAECQETIFLLGKQLNALRPQSEVAGSQQRDQGLPEDKPSSTRLKLQEYDLADMDTATSVNAHRVSTESHIDVYSSPCSPADADGNPLKSPVNSKNPKHRPTKSSCSSLSSTPTPEKHARGIGRFFSSKGKNGH